MIETTIPTVNVAEVMARVRATVAEIRAREQKAIEAEAIATSAPDLTLGMPPPPAPYRPKPVDAKRERLLGWLKQAEASTAVASWIPKPLRRFFRSQSAYNRLVVDTMSTLVKTNAQLASRVQQLADVDQAQHQWLEGLFQNARALAEANRARAPRALVDQLQRQIDTVARDYRSELDRSGEHLRNLQSQVDAGLAAAQVRQDEYRAETRRSLEAQQTLHAQLSGLSSFVEGVREKVDAVAGDAERTGAHVRNLQVEVDRLSAQTPPLQNQLTRLEGQFALIREELNRSGEHLRNLDVEIRRILDTAGRDAVDRKLGALEQRLTDDGSFLKAELTQHRAMLSQLAKPRRAAQRNSAAAPMPLTSSGDGMLDAFYLSFEDRFRGSRAEIKERLTPYLPVIEAAGAATEDRPLLDVGCGRGEWLELLQSHGRIARGLDINDAMLAHCRERRLEVTKADVLEHLRSLPDDALGAVTGFHIIEHLSFEVLMNVLAETFRVLLPGGVVVFESPNCKNLTVGASTFNLDPTHRNPVFPETAEFMLQVQGFTRTEIRYLSPAEGSPFTDTRPEWAHLHARLFGPQDFSVIGYKATPR